MCTGGSQQQREASRTRSRRGLTDLQLLEQRAGAFWYHRRVCRAWASRHEVACEARYEPGQARQDRCRKRKGDCRSHEADQHANPTIMQQCFLEGYLRRRIIVQHSAYDSLSVKSARGQVSERTSPAVELTIATACTAAACALSKSALI